MTTRKPISTLSVTEIAELCPMICSSATVCPKCAVDFEHTRAPECGLLAAILERAVRDLGPDVDHMERASAINWFTGVREQSLHDPHFSFEDVALFLELGKLEIDKLRNMVRYAIQYGARKPKGDA